MKREFHFGQRRIKSLPFNASQETRLVSESSQSVQRCTESVCLKFILFRFFLSFSLVEHLLSCTRTRTRFALCLSHSLSPSLSLTLSTHPSTHPSSVAASLLLPCHIHILAYRMAPFFQQIKRFINKKSANKDMKQDSGTVVTTSTSTTHSSASLASSSSATMDRDHKASKQASSQSHTPNTNVPSSSQHQQQHQPQQEEQPAQNILSEPTQNNNNHHNNHHHNNNTAAFGINSNTEAASRMIDEENRQRNKLPVYPGLERFQLIEKMGE